MDARTLEGEPRTIYGKEFVPVVRVLSYFRRGSDEEAPGKVSGGGLVIMRPVAVLETGPQGTKRIRISDMTNIAVMGLLLAGLLLSLTVGSMVRLVKRSG